MPMALLLMPSHAISSRDMYMHHGCMLHGSSERSGARTVIPVFDMLMQKPCAERSQQLPRSGRSSGESTNSGPTRLQHCATIAQQHSQAKETHARGSLWSWLACSPQGAAGEDP